MLLKRCNSITKVTSLIDKSAVTQSLAIVLILISTLSQSHTQDFEGTLLVVNKRANSVAFIDLVERKIVATRETGEGPHELVVTDDGEWAVITDYAGGNSLSVFHVPSATKVREIDLRRYPRPHGILLLKDQKQVIVSSEASNSVVIANFHSGQIQQVLATNQRGSHMVALSEDPYRVYTTNMGDNTVSEIDIDSQKLLRQLPMPAIPEAITVNRAGTELWVGSNRDGLLSIFDLASGKLIQQWPEFIWPYRILLTKNEQYAVVPDYRQDSLDVFSVQSKKRLRRLNFVDGTSPKGMILYPDERTLFMSAYGKDQIYAIDILSGEQLFTLPTGQGPDGIGYSPLQISIATSDE